MKKMWMLLAVLSLMLTGCGKEGAASAETKQPEGANSASVIDQQEPGVTVHPLPDTTMDNLDDAILSVSLGEGDAYVDDTGKMQMNVKIYTYDKYDMVDIAQLKEGDIIVTRAGEVEVQSLEQSESGVLFVNGGLEGGGFDLVTDDCGVYFETGYNDAKNWYEIGEATIRVSADFKGSDNADPDAGEVVLYPGSFLVGEVTDYNFTPYNTTIRVEGGQIVEMTRMYTP